MNADAAYNGALGNAELKVTFTGDTSVDAPNVVAIGTGNDGVHRNHFRRLQW